MTTTYDPQHPEYLDEADVRGELTRVFDLCHGCQRCVESCASFPTLFEMIDRHDDRDSGRMTPADQDSVVDQCFQCKRCYVKCPYVPGLHEQNIDVPRLMLRATAMQHSNRLSSKGSKVATRIMVRTDLVGTLGTSTSHITNKILAAKPGSMTRKVLSVFTGVSAVRLLPQFAQQRFSTWFAKRPKVRLGRRQGKVTVFPTCVVEYQETNIGKDLVRVYERNGIECSTTAARCCGAPWLHAGDVKKFTGIAKQNIKTLAAEIRTGTDVVVPQPTCSYVLKKDYPDYVGGPDAEFVAAHTYDAVEYLMRLHQADDTVLDTDFDGDTVQQVTYHSPDLLKAQNIGFLSRDLIKLTDAKMNLVQQCSGTGGIWGLRAANDEISAQFAEKLGAMIDSAGGDLVAGDCHLDNTAIVEQTGRRVQHPLQVIARAYGISEENRPANGAVDS